MRYQDTAFPDIQLIYDEHDVFVGILTADGIEASTIDAPFVSDQRVLSYYDEACRSIRQILHRQLGLELPKGFAAELSPEDLTLYCTEHCSVEEMDAYLQKKREAVREAVAIWQRERPWDTNPIAHTEAQARNYVFDASTGALGTDGCVNTGREVELPSSIDGRRVTTLKTACLVSYPYLETLVMPDSVTEIEPFAFYDCIYLKRVTLSQNLRVLPEGMFGRCRSLASVVIPDGVQEIRQEAFYRCGALANVNVPDSVVTVGRCAFLGVQHIRYHGSARGFPWGATVGN